MSTILRQVDSRADQLLRDRAQRNANVRTYNVNGKELSEQLEQPPAVNLERDTILRERLTPTQAPVWDLEGFVPGHLQSAIPFWKDVMLNEVSTEERETSLRWLPGYSVHEFVNVEAGGIFQGHQYRGAGLTPVELPSHVPAEFTEWVGSEVAKLEERGCTARWDVVADITIRPKPVIIMPLGVEPKKPRLFWDGRWLDLMCKRMPFKMDGVGKVAQCSWAGAHQVTLDHRSGFHNQALHEDSWH